MTPRPRALVTLARPALPVPVLLVPLASGFALVHADEARVYAANTVSAIRHN
jgi:hypothetical protein